MVNFPEVLALGALAGFTIFFGLPVILLDVNAKVRGFLNALAIGILLFLIVDVFSHAWDTTRSAAKAAYGGTGGVETAGIYLVMMFGGLTLGLLGLVFYERRYMKSQGSGVDMNKLSTMIALGIGAHNLSEGLAIGQSYAAGAVSLAIVLIIGFGAHNATEGFGITAPLLGAADKPKTGFLVKLLLIGGAPTFFGTLLGSLYFSPEAYVLFLALAGGALVYVTMMLYNAGRRRYSNDLMMTGIFLGLLAGFLTDLIVSLGGA